jgi:hypothetical protein
VVAATSDTTAGAGAGVHAPAPAGTLSSRQRQGLSAVAAAAAAACSNSDANAKHSSKPKGRSKQKRASRSKQKQQQQADEGAAAWEEDAISEEDDDAAQQQQHLVYDAALHSLTGRPLPASSAMDLGDNLRLMYSSRQVVPVVLPPNSAPIPLALVELQEDVVCRVDGDTTLYTQPSYAGKELVELESEAHVYERAGGTCRVAGANISRAVRMSKMMYLNGTTVFQLDADEWDTLALQTLGE